MSTFAKTVADKVESYIALHRSLGYAFRKQASILRSLARYVQAEQLDGPLTRATALRFVFSWQGTANHRAISHGIVRRFCEYLAIYDPRTEALDPRALPRSRAIPPPRVLSDAELGSLISGCRRVSPGYPERGVVLTMIVGLLASTGLRSGEALRLDRADVDLADGVLHIRKTKFRNRLVPVHATTLRALLATDWPSKGTQAPQRSPAIAMPCTCWSSSLPNAPGVRHIVPCAGTETRIERSRGFELERPAVGLRPSAANRTIERTPGFLAHLGRFDLCFHNFGRPSA
jgi:integrase